MVPNELRVAFFLPGSGTLYGSSVRWHNVDVPLRDTGLTKVSMANCAPLKSDKPSTLRVDANQGC